MAAETQMLVYSNPAEGREKDFNDWYNNVHLPEVIAYPGISGAQRFSVNAAIGDFTFKYVAVYDLEAGIDAMALWNKLGEDAGKGLLTMTDALGPELVMHLLQPVCPYRTA